MITLGVILLVLGLIFKVNILWTIGIVLLVVGGILLLLGAVNRPVFGRSHFW